MKSTTVKPLTTFDWAIYVDATLAGLAILVPIPLLDVFLEWLFKRRIPGAVAKRNGRELSRYTIHYLNSQPFSCVGCLLLPFSLVLLLLKRIYRTILYFLTVKEASDKLSLYWHRAFLIDFMVRRGDLDNEKTAKVAALAMHDVLDRLTTSPLHALAKQVIGSMHHSLRTIWRWRRRHEKDADLQNAQQAMEISWERFTTYFEEVGQQYVSTFERFQTAQVADTIVMNTPVETLASRLIDKQSDSLEIKTDKESD